MKSIQPKIIRILKNSWKDLNFKKCQEKVSSSSLIKIYKDKFENEIEKIFKDSLSFWIKKNLPDLIKDETALYKKNIRRQTKITLDFLYFCQDM